MKFLNLLFFLNFALLLNGCATSPSFSAGHGLASTAGDSTLKINGSRFVRDDGSEFYVHGVNLPWLDGHYGNGFAPSFFHPEWGVFYNHELMLQRLTQIQSLNVNVVRLFLFTDLQGFKIDSAGNLTGLDPVFLENLDDTVKIASSLSLKLYIVLLEGMNGLDDTRAVQQPLFFDSVKQTQLMNNVIRVVARRYAGSSAIIAFDILNESNAEVQGDVKWSDILHLIQNAAEAIHAEDPTRLVSCSLIKANAKNMNVLIDKYSDLGLDFYDTHQYSNTPDLPVTKDYQLGKPIIVGEYGQNEGEKEHQQALTTGLFLRQARDRGWAGALAWAFDFPGSPKEHRLMNSDGSWRPAAQIIRDFAAELPHSP